MKHDSRKNTFSNFAFWPASSCALCARYTRPIVTRSVNFSFGQRRASRSVSAAECARLYVSMDRYLYNTISQKLDRNCRVVAVFFFFSFRPKSNAIIIMIVIIIIINSDAVGKRACELRWKRSAFRCRSATIRETDSRSVEMLQ